MTILIKHTCGCVRKHELCGTRKKIRAQSERLSDTKCFLCTCNRTEKQPFGEKLDIPVQPGL